MKINEIEINICELTEQELEQVRGGGINIRTSNEFKLGKVPPDAPGNYDIELYNRGQVDTCPGCGGVTIEVKQGQNIKVEF